MKVKYKNKMYEVKVGVNGAHICVGRGKVYIGRPIKNKKRLSK